MGHVGSTSRHRCCLTRAALPSLQDPTRGLVSNVSAGIGVVGMPLYATDPATEAGIAPFGLALRRELYGEGVPVRTVYLHATSTPVMEYPKGGAAQGFEYELPESVSGATADAHAEAAVEAILDGSRTILRGGQPRRDELPGPVDG